MGKQQGEFGDANSMVQASSGVLKNGLAWSSDRMRKIVTEPR